MSSRTVYARNWPRAVGREKLTLDLVAQLNWEIEEEGGLVGHDELHDVEER